MERQWLTYGLQEGKLKHIQEVENGLACNCVCSNCKHPLVAKNNPSNYKVAHFAHKSGKECEGAIESAIHLLAKSILLKTKTLRTPDYHFDNDKFNRGSIFKKGQLLIFDEIFLEEKVEVNGEKIIPDAIGLIEGKKVFIEFANTHFVDEIKREKIKVSGVACIEIDLSNELLDSGELTLLMQENTLAKYWISNPRLDKEYAEFIQLQKQKQEKGKIEKALKEERRKKESAAKYERYKNDIGIKLFQRRENRVSKCPKKFEALKGLKTERFYNHIILRRIIDGEFWNGKFYGVSPNGRYIYLGKEEIYVYPPNSQNEQLNSSEKKSFDFFFAGLSKIKDILEDDEFGNCTLCEFSGEHFQYQEKDLQVCKHSE